MRAPVSFSEPISAFEMRRHLKFDHGIDGWGAGWFELVALHVTDHDQGDLVVAHRHQEARHGQT